LPFWIAAASHLKIEEREKIYDEKKLLSLLSHGAVNCWLLSIAICMDCHKIIAVIRPAPRSLNLITSTAAAAAAHSAIFPSL
jgi:hypothetical protein